MARMALRLHVPFWRLPFLFWKGRQEMIKHIDMVQPFDGMKEVVRQLHSDGHKLFVVSSDSVQNIQTFMENNDMNTNFVKISSGGFGLFGKARVLRKTLEQNHLKTDETFYIGDEVRDIRAARGANIRAVAVSWGYSNLKELTKHNPAALVTNPSQILNAVEGNHV